MPTLSGACVGDSWVWTGGQEDDAPNCGGLKHVHGQGGGPTSFLVAGPTRRGRSAVTLDRACCSTHITRCNSSTRTEKRRVPKRKDGGWSMTRWAVRRGQSDRLAGKEGTDGVNNSSPSLYPVPPKPLCRLRQFALSTHTMIRDARTTTTAHTRADSGARFHARLASRRYLLAGHVWAGGPSQGADPLRRAR